MSSASAACTSARPSRVSLFSLNASLVLALGLFVVDGPAAAQTPDNDKIVVSGASGQLGGLVVEELLARGVRPENLILVSRTPGELSRYAAMGASTRFGDFTQPESLPAAYAGGTRMLLISISTLNQRPELHKNAIDAAVQAGVRHIAYTSFVDAENNTSSIAADHRRTEEFLRQSGVAWTMLRNQLYMDGLVAQAARMLAAGEVTVQPNETRTGYVTRQDCAAAAAAVLTTPGHENRAYEITGPAAIGQRDIALAASEVTGIPIRIVEATAPAGRAAAAGRGGGAAPAPAASGALVSTAVADLTGRPATSIRDLLQSHRDELPTATR
jgi:NAD(P)H dehydrogenase (quinone)